MWPMGLLFLLRDFSGVVEHPRGLQVSQYVVSVEYSSLLVIACLS